MGKRDTAVIVCNYNKKPYVLACVESILSQNMRNALDIYVVDNASTDGSADALRKCFGREIKVLENPVNNGGSGGFNAGMKAALTGDYKYLVLADNDVRMAEEALEKLHSFLECQPDAGIVGAATLKMDAPNTVMALGARLDTQKYEYHDNFRGSVYGIDLPEVLECDYVPACTLMVRREAVERVGLMDESYFLYWDDIDWAMRMKRAGYRVVALRDAKVWHKGGGIAAPTTAPIYYFIRNRIHFYAKYLTEQEIEIFTCMLLQDIFTRIHGCYPKGKHNYVMTMVRAYEDGLRGVRGKVAEDVILPDVEEHNEFKAFMEGHDSVLFELDDSVFSRDGWEWLAHFVELLRGEWPQVCCVFLCPQDSYCKEEVQRRILFHGNVSFAAVEAPEHGCRIVRFCENIRDVMTYEPGQIFVDGRQNIIKNYEDYLYFRSFEVGMDMFVRSQQRYFMDCIRNLHDKSGVQS